MEIVEVILNELNYYNIEKHVSVELLKSAITFDEYNKLIKSKNVFGLYLTQEEFDLLKKRLEKMKIFFWKVKNLTTDEIETIKVCGKTFKEAEEKICDNPFFVPLGNEGWTEMEK